MPSSYMDQIAETLKSSCQLFRSDHAPIAQMADIGFKVVLLERLNQKWKQKHF